jgi:hypothetical protein
VGVGWYLILRNLEKREDNNKEGRQQQRWKTTTKRTTTTKSKKLRAENSTRKVAGSIPDGDTGILH